MLKYLLHRLLAAVPVVLGLSIIVFLVMKMIPGDPALALLGSYATPDNVTRINVELGLDRSWPEQYVRWISGALQGNLGRSFVLNRPVMEEVLERLSATVILALPTLVLSSLIGVAAGTYAAARQFGRADMVLTTAVLLGISIPTFWLGLLFILVFAVKLGALPVSGMYSATGDRGMLDLVRHMILPVVTLSCVAAGAIARMTRTAMLEVLRQDFIRTARAKGVGEFSVLSRHAFRAALVSVVPIIGLQAGFVLGGSVYVETVFQWPGIGQMLVKAVSTRDILLVQGGVLVASALYVLINLATDVVQAWLDPRLRQ